MNTLGTGSKPMKEFVRFIKTSGIYLLGNVLTKAIAFFMLPIYTKFLTPSDYGTYDVNIAYITFLSSVLFLDIWGGVMRFMFDYSKREDKDRPIMSGAIIFLGSTIAYVVFALFLGNVMHIQYLFWVMLYGLFLNLQQFFAYVVRGFGKNSLFAISGILGSFITMLSNILFIAIMHTGYQYLYISSIIGYLLNCSVLFFGVNIKEIFQKKNYDSQLTKEMFIFSLPLMINSISWWFLTAFNRVILTNQLSSAANGVYAVANKFSSIVQLIDQAFQMAWQEISFSKEGAKKDNAVFFESAINEYIRFMLMGVAALLPIVRMIFPYFVDSSFNAAFNVIPLALIATILASISTFLGGTLTAIKRNRYLFTTTIFGTIVNIFVLLGTIKFIDVQAASLALGSGYLVVDIRRYFLLKKYINIHIKSFNLILSICVVCISAASYMLGNYIVNIIAFLLILLLFIYIYRKMIRKLLDRIVS